MTLYRAIDELERLLLGADGTGSGLLSLLTAGGLGAADAEVYVEAMRTPGAMTAALHWYRAMERSDPPTRSKTGSVKRDRNCTGKDRNPDPLRGPGNGLPTPISPCHNGACCHAAGLSSAIKSLTERFRHSSAASARPQFIARAPFSTL